MWGSREAFVPRFRSDTRAKPDEVAVDIGEDGSTARVLPPQNSGSSLEICDLRLSTALHVAGALADRLGTQVCVIDRGDHIYILDGGARSLIAC
jgi:hypothetical protein